jgi:hypothetical protein
MRLAKNFTARRNVLPDSAGGRPPEYGTLARTYRGKRIARTPPDAVATWQQHGLAFRAKFWYDLVLLECFVTTTKLVTTTVFADDALKILPHFGGLPSEGMNPRVIPPWPFVLKPFIRFQFLRL